MKLTTMNAHVGFHAYATHVVPRKTQGSKCALHSQDDKAWLGVLGVCRLASLHKSLHLSYTDICHRMLPALAMTKLHRATFMPRLMNQILGIPEAPSQLIP